jgi:hypothetical protein
MESQLPKSKSRKPSSSQETLEMMKQAEALEWMDRYREKAYEHGMNHARTWWAKVLYDIRRIRGEKAADELRDRMNRIRNEIRQKG